GSSSPRGSRETDTFERRGSKVRIAFSIASPNLRWSLALLRLSLVKSSRPKTSSDVLHCSNSGEIGCSFRLVLSRAPRSRQRAFSNARRVCSRVGSASSLESGFKSISRSNTERLTRTRLSSEDISLPIGPRISLPGLISQLEKHKDGFFAPL